MKSNSSFVSLVDGGWFKEYLDEMDLMKNEMPMAFHFLSAAVVLGQGLGFETYGKLAKGVHVYPNINSMLLSPAGRCRRGEGTKFAGKIARLAGLNVLEGKATAEGLFMELMDDANPAGQGNVLLYVEELSVMLSKASYMQTIVPFLTKCLLNSGGAIDERLKGQGKITIPRCNLSALFTTAPDWFLTSMPEEAYGGGLMSRFVPCYLPEREVFHVDPNAEGDNGEALTRLAMKMRLLIKSAPKKHVKMSVEGAEWFKKWYMENERRVVIDARMEPHRNRAPANALRMALLLAVSNGEGEISKDRIQQAIAILEWIAPTVWAMYGFTDEMGSGVSRGEKLVCTVIGEQLEGEMLHQDLMLRVLSRFKDKKDMIMCMEGLEEKGILRRELRRNQPRASWPPLGWKLVNREKEKE